MRGDPVQPPAIRETAPVAEEVLRAYVGRYRLTPEMIAKVTLEDGRLYIDPDGQGRHRLHAASELDCILRDGAVAGPVFRQVGREVPAERLE